MQPSVQSNGATPGAEGRQCRRFDVARPVLVFCGHSEPVPGETIDMSRTGAAVRLAHTVAVEALASGDEIVVQGLVEVPVDCWVVDCHDDLLRLRFVANDVADARIASVIRGLEAVAREPDQPPGAGDGDAEVSGKRRLVTWAMVALTVTALVGGAVWWRVGHTDAASGSAPDRLAERITETVSRRPGAGGPGTASYAVVLGAGVADRLAVTKDAGTMLFELPAGSRFAVRIDSVAGATEAELVADIYEQGGKRVLLPRGTRLIGLPAGAGGLVWTQVLLPGGRTMTFRSLGTDGDHPTTLTDAPLASAGPAAGAGGLVVVNVNRDIALPAYPAGK